MVLYQLARYDLVICLFVALCNCGNGCYARSCEAACSGTEDLNSVCSKCLWQRMVTCRTVWYLVVDDKFGYHAQLSVGTECYDSEWHGYSVEPNGFVSCCMTVLV